MKVFAMLKINLSTWLIVAVLSLFIAGTAFAQKGAAPQDIFANEGPITQADIDVIVAVWPQMMSPGNVVPPKALFEQYGIGDHRGAYLTTKIGNAYIINVYPHQREYLMSLMPASLIPSQEEIDLVGYNMPTLNDIYNPGRYY